MVQLLGSLTCLSFCLASLEYIGQEGQRSQMGGRCQGENLRAITSKLQDSNLRSDAIDELRDWLDEDDVGDQREPLLAALVSVLVAVEKAQDAQGYCESISNLIARLGKPVAPSLVRLTTHTCPLVRQCAVRTLAKQKCDCPKAIDATVSRLDDACASVREEACKTLRVVHQCLSPNSIRKLVRRLGDSSPQVVSAAAWGLGELGKKAEQAIPDLMKLLDRQDYHANSICFGALLSMTNMPVKDKRYIPKLARLLQRDWDKLDIDTDGVVWIFLEIEPIAVILGGYGKAAKGAIPALEQLLRVKKNGIDEHIHTAISHALLLIDPKHDPAQTMLRKLARSADRKCRTDVLVCLSNLPIEVRRTMRDVLARLSSDEDDSVSEEAGELLRSIQPEE